MIQKFFQSLSSIGQGFIVLQTSTGLYIAMVLSMVVMGLRSSQFITRLVNVLVWNIGDLQLSLLGIVIAVAMILFVVSGSFYAGTLPVGSKEQRMAAQVRDLAVFADGLFNMVETIYVVISHDATTAVLQYFTPGANLSPEWFIYNGVRLVVILAILGIGLFPTLLAFRASQLLGALQSTAASQPQKKTIDVISLTIKQKEHLTKAINRLGDNKNRPFIYTGMAKAIGVPESDLFSALDQARVSGLADMTNDPEGRFFFTPDGIATLSS